LPVDDADVDTKIADLVTRLDSEIIIVKDLQSLRNRFMAIKKTQAGDMKNDEQTGKALTTERRQTIYDGAVADYNALP